MNFYRQNWYYLGGILFIFLAYFMGFWGGDHLTEIQLILVYSFMAMLAHQFEEYAFPGGFQGIGNIAMFGERKMPDRYPLNANQVMISNVFLTYPFYIIPVFFPDLIWLGLIQVGQGMVQIINHGIITNVRMKTIYNPGLATVLLLQWPLGVYYIHFVSVHHLATTSDYFFGLFGAFASTVVLWIGPILLLSDRGSKYPFSEADMFKFMGQRLREMLTSPPGHD